MEVDRLSEGLTRINMDMEADAKHGVYWPGFVALGAATFAIFNFLTRWLLPGERQGEVRCPSRECAWCAYRSDEVTFQIAAMLKYSSIII